MKRALLLLLVMSISGSAHAQSSSIMAVALHGARRPPRLQPRSTLRRSLR